jgi:hypothetical protein
VVDASHWDGLPDGHTRATTTDPDTSGQPSLASRIAAAEPLSILLARRGANQPVPTRSLSVYADAAKENQ